MADASTAPRLPLKPVWIHDLLILWRRNQALALLLERAGDYAAQEIRSASVRRAVLAQAAVHFVETRGQGKAARTLPQNVWASYSRNFPAAALAPAYLVHLTAQWPLALDLTVAWADRLTPGQGLDQVFDEALLAELLGAEPDGNAAPARGRLAELDAWLRTLHYFGVLAARRSAGVEALAGRYVFAGRLAVPPPVFPLLVWTWWQQQGMPTVDLADFARSPLLGWMAAEDFAAGWAAAAGKLWTLDASGCTARLHPGDRAGFVRALLNLLSTDGRRGRNLPRRGELPEPPEPPAEAAARASRT
ncbi:MAG: hypothetical protein DCC57_23535 [Chloroflexi bacterium]|nr:MAG: hypothetical protein DCC57_23535 [Chloroflexota bacterium]